MLSHEIKRFFLSNWIFVVGLSVIFIICVSLTGMSQIAAFSVLLCVVIYYVFAIWRMNTFLLALEKKNQAHCVQEVTESTEVASLFTQLIPDVSTVLTQTRPEEKKEEQSLEMPVLPNSALLRSFVDKRVSHSRTSDLIRVIITTLNGQKELYSVNDFSILVAGITFHYVKFVSEISQVSVTHQLKINQFVDQFKNMDDHLFDVRFAAAESALLALNNLFDASMVGMGGQGISAIAKQIYGFSVQSNKATHRMRSGLEETEKSLRDLQEKLKGKIDEEINSALLEKGKIDSFLSEFTALNRMNIMFNRPEWEGGKERDELIAFAAHRCHELVQNIEGAFFDMARHFQLIKNIWKKKLLGGNKHESYLDDSLLLNCQSIELENNKNFTPHFTRVEK